MKKSYLLKTFFLLLAMIVTGGSAAWADTYKVTYNGSEVSTPSGYFTHDTSEGAKWSFNNKFKGATYDGTTFTQGLKMESATKIMFTSTGTSTVTIVQSTWSANTIKFDGTALEVDGATAGTGYRVYTISNVAAGDHTVTRGSGESGLFYIKVESVGGSNKQDATLAFSTTSGSVDIANGTSFTLPSVTGAPANATLTYSSNKESVAKVNATTGAVTLVGEGTAVITATFAGDNTYNSKNLTYTLTVTDSRPKVVANLLLDNTTKTAADGSTYTFTNQGRTFTITNGNSKTYGNGGDYVKYSANVQYTINIPANVIVESITFTGYDNLKDDASNRPNGFIQEFNGQQFTEGNANVIFPENKSTAIQTFTLQTPQTGGTITFTPGGNQLCLSISINNVKETKWAPSYNKSNPATYYGGDQITNLIGITMTFGGTSDTQYKFDKNAKSADNATDAYTESGKIDDNGQNPTISNDNIPTAGTYYKFEPDRDGQLTIYYTLNGNKSLLIVEDGVVLTSETVKPASKVTQAIKTFNVKGGSTYYVYTSGSKLGFGGFKFARVVLDEDYMPKSADIAAFKAQSEGTRSVLTLTDAIVTASTDAGVYIEDANGGMLLDKGSLNLTVGDKLNGTITLKRTEDGAATIASTTMDGVTKTAGEVAATEATLAQAATEAKADMYVKLTGVTVTKNGDKYYVNQGGNRLEVLGTLYNATNDIDGKVKLASIAGIVSGNTIAPTKANDIVAGEDQSLNEVSIAEFKQLAQEEKAIISETTAWITFNDGNSLYVQNGTNAIKVDSEDNLQPSAVTNIKITATLDKEAADAPIANGTLMLFSDGDGNFNTPRYTDISELKKAELIHAMVRMGRSRFADNKLMMKTDESKYINVVDKFQKNIDIPEELTYIVGIIGKNGNDYEFYPVHADSLKQYSSDVTLYAVGDEQDFAYGDNGQVTGIVETIAKGEMRKVTGAIMTAQEDMPLTEEAVVVSAGETKEHAFTHKAQAESLMFDATREGTLVLYLEKQNKQPITVTVDGKVMKNFDAIEQQKDSIEIPVVGGKTYIVSTTKDKLNLRGMTFSSTNNEALDVARNIALFKALYNGIATEDTLQLHDAVVTYIKGDQVYVEDASGAIILNQTQIQFYKNQVLNGFIVGKDTKVKNTPMLLRTSKTTYTTFKATNGQAIPTSLTIADLKKEQNLSRFVKVSNVQVTRDRQGFRILKDNTTGATIRIEDHFNVFYELPEYLKGIEGIVGIDTEGTLFLWPTTKQGVVESPVPATFETGKYYIGNISAGLEDANAFWGAGNSVGTQASLLKHAEYVTLHKLADGQYQMESQVSNGGTQYFFNGDYMDNGSPMTLTITRSQEPIGYADDDETEPIYGWYIANEESYFGWDGQTTVLGKNIDKSSDNALWMIGSEDEMMASLNDATEDDPADATFLILNPNFSRNNRNKSAWTVEASNNNLGGGDNTNFVAESYMSTFVVSQELTVPNGKYVLNAQAAVTFHDNRTVKEYDGNGYPVIFANDKTSDFNEMETEDQLTSMSKFSELFSAGKYQVEPIEVIVTDGKLTIGAKSERSDIWAVWDNFELTYYGPVSAKVEKTKVWDFTQWSQATITDLKADAAASKTEGWSDVEKKADAEAGNDPTEASKDNCFWLAGTPNADGELTANGNVIEETKGLVFHNATYTGARSLAIATNYPSTTLGNYAGGQYLWLGGKNNECFTIPGCTAGGSLTIVAESHKPAEARGIKLIQAGTEIGSFTPTTQDTYTVNIANDGDVIVKNTNGCHIYSITLVYLADEDDEPAGGKAFDVTYAMVADEAHASADVVSINDIDNEEIATLTFGEADGADFHAAKAEGSVEGFTACTDGNGQNGNKAGGTFYVFKPKYDGKADFAVVLNADKSFYIEEDGTALADYNGIKVAEKYYGIYTADVKAGSTYKIYCAGSKLGFYGVRYYSEGGSEQPVPTAISEVKTVKAEGVYSLSGVKVADTTDGLKPGLYIIGGRKVVIK